MKDKVKIQGQRESIKMIIDEIAKNYWFPLIKFLESNPTLIKTFPALLINHEQVVFYMGKTHLAIEYYGPETTNKLRDSGKMEFNFYDYSLSKKKLIDLIVGFNYDSTSKLKFQLPNYSDDWILPTNAGLDKLTELGWNFMAQNSLIGFNFPGFEIPKGEFCRIVNGRFYDADNNGLKSRHIKWIDFIPLEYDDSNEEYDTFGMNFKIFNQLVERDANYVYPLPSKDDFKFNKLPQINRFIELTGNKDTTETEITSYLEKDENKFILTMAFLAREIQPQKLCEWQTEVRDSIKPDFFIVKPNGFADIVEFKLPDLKSNAIVGKTNRETFSADINSYISQTRVYRTYFEDPNNRKWVEDKYGIKVRYPRRILIVGRRWDFSSEEWKEIIDDFNDIEIMTYDDLIDGVVAQFYM